MFTKSLSADYGSRGVRANCVCPGLIDTPMASWLKEDPASFRAWEASIPAQRVGTVEDIANAVSYLASDASSYVFGESLVVDGGSIA
jgi:NAD(P)-dependent dehydrogenase (short-subunit alcohol dehydrogenase family)